MPRSLTPLHGSQGSLAGVPALREDGLHGEVLRVGGRLYAMSPCVVKQVAAGKPRDLRAEALAALVFADMERQLPAPRRLRWPVLLPEPEDAADHPIGDHGREPSAVPVKGAHLSQSATRRAEAEPLILTSAVTRRVIIFEYRQVRSGCAR